MINSVNQTNNTSFGRRCIRIHNQENIPKAVLKAIKENPAFDTFVKNGEPKTFSKKLLDLFKPNEYLDILYSKEKNIRSCDPYKQNESMSFLLGQRLHKTRFFFLREYQEGLYRPNRKINTPDEAFIKPDITSTDKLVAKIKEMTNLDELLK